VLQSFEARQLKERPGSFFLSLRDPACRFRKSHVSSLEPFGPRPSLRSASFWDVPPMSIFIGDTETRRKQDRRAGAWYRGGMLAAEGKRVRSTTFALLGKPAVAPTVSASIRHSHWRTSRQWPPTRDARMLFDGTPELTLGARLTPDSYLLTPTAGVARTRNASGWRSHKKTCAGAAVLRGSSIDGTPWQLPSVAARPGQGSCPGHPARP